MVPHAPRFRRPCRPSPLPSRSSASGSLASTLDAWRRGHEHARPGIAVLAPVLVAVPALPPSLLRGSHFALDPRLGVAGFVDHPHERVRPDRDFPLEIGEALLPPHSPPLAPREALLRETLLLLNELTRITRIAKHARCLDDERDPHPEDGPDPPTCPGLVPQEEEEHAEPEERHRAPEEPAHSAPAPLDRQARLHPDARASRHRAALRALLRFEIARRRLDLLARDPDLARRRDEVFVANLFGLGLLAFDGTLQDRVHLLARVGRRGGRHAPVSSMPAAGPSSPRVIAMGSNVARAFSPDDGLRRRERAAR